jgi:Protein of unknown function (DUF3987)/Primase C terminal 2 (PriCT-2)
VEPHPKTYCGDIADPPAALSPLVLRDQWVCWKWQRNSNGRGWTKPPFRADFPNELAANNSLKTWGTYSAAVKAVTSGKAHGIGFVLTGTNIGAVDLDHCRDPETGLIDHWAQDVLDAAANAYHEVTVSGRGLRIIGIAAGAPQHKRFPVTGRLGAALEIYRGATRYITVSGLEISKCASLPSIDGLIDQLVVRYENNGSKFDFEGKTHDQKQGEKKEEKPKPEWSAQEEARIRAALKFVPAVDRQVWLHVGMALHWIGWGDKARQIWDDWSQTCLEKYDEEDQAKTWRGFRAQRDKAKTLATLFDLAIAGGWDSATEIVEGDTAWNDPDFSILDDRRGELPDFPLEVFSPSWQHWAKAAAHGAGVGIDHVMVPLIGIASSLIGTARRVRASRSWSEPFTVWVAVVGFSGSGKSPGLNVTRNALAKIENDRKARVDALRQEHDSNAERARAVFKAWKDTVKEAVEKGLPAPPMPNDANVPDDFVAPRLYLSNATIERIAVLLEARPRGMLMVCDELAGLFLNLNRYSSGTDRPFWLECWNGGPYAVERMGRPPLRVDHLLVGVVGGFQPDKMARSFQGDADGLYGRLLYAWPLEPAYRELTDSIEEVEPEFENTLVRLIDLPAEEDDTLIITPVPLSAEARENFEAFRKFAFRERAALDGREREWWSKAQTEVLRLAGTLAYLDWARRTAGQPIFTAEPNRIEAKFVDAGPNPSQYSTGIGMSLAQSDLAQGRTRTAKPRCRSRTSAGTRWAKVLMLSKPNNCSMRS